MVTSLYQVGSESFVTMTFGCTHGWSLTNVVHVSLSAESADLTIVDEKFDSCIVCPEVVLEIVLSLPTPFLLRASESMWFSAW